MSRHFILPGPPPLTIELRRSARARRLSLRVSRIDGAVRLTLPRFASAREAESFAREKENWLRATLAAQPVQQQVAVGMAIPVEGTLRQITRAEVKRLTLTEDALLLPLHAKSPEARVAAFLKARARDRLVAASDAYAAALGRGYGKITLRDTRSRWGSCTSDGNLMYSWRLIMAPPGVLDYVAAHEVAHLAEMNHSPRFWATVERLRPGHTPERRWLKSNGGALHAYLFKSVQM